MVSSGAIEWDEQGRGFIDGQPTGLTSRVEGNAVLIRGPKSTDPAVTEWRAALGQSASAQLRQTQRDLAASQADLTRVEAENADWRATAERSLAAQEQMARELATANYQNRILTAELDSALRRLNEKEGKS